MVIKSWVVTKQVTVIKLGGSILRNPQDFDEILKKITQQFKEHRLILVVSAIKGITDLIIDLCEKPNAKDTLKTIVTSYYNVAENLNLNDEVLNKLRELEQELVNTLQKCDKPLYKDRALSFGERASALIVNSWLKSKGFASKLLGPNDIGLITTAEYGNAEPIIPEVFNNIKQSLKPIIEKEIIPVIPGFIGVDMEGNITTMGRGASDLTATLVARSLNADNLYLVTETPGIMSADPRIVPEAKIVPIMDIDEARIAAEYKVKNLHKRTFAYISDFGGLIKIVNKNFIGTTILNSYAPSIIKIVTNYNDLIVMIGRGTNKIIENTLYELNLDKMHVLSVSELHAVLNTPWDVYDTIRKLHRTILR